MGNILEVLDVEQSFRVGFWLKRHVILSNVNLNVPEGSIFGFLGANGAGKTTLIHLITGIRKATQGSVRVLGFPAESLQAKSHIGYLPERPYFHEHLTGEGVLKLYGALSGMKQSDILSSIPRVLSAVGMKEARKVELKRYSKGMLQRIGIAQALIHDPEFLVLDEPMSGLDPFGRKEVRELILSLAAEGRTIFFSSHVISDVEAICDHVALLKKGKLIGSGKIQSFLSRGPNKIEIAFKQSKLSSVKTWSEFEAIREVTETFRGIISRQDLLNPILTKLLSEGAEILWVNPIRPSLEKVLESDSKFDEEYFEDKTGDNEGSSVHRLDNVS